MEDKSQASNLVIRHYKPGDLEACRYLWFELTDWHRDLYNSPTIGGENPGLLFDEHLTLVGADNIWVAEVDGNVVGLTGLISDVDEPELEPIVVNSSYRGLGIGRRLIETVMEAARQKGVRQLKVRPVGRNEQAIQFFHEQGFNVIGHIELFQDINAANQDVWRDGEKLAGKNFKV
ncbi:MAG: GNAT family N-acetyltransferase [Chloroflexi bacterium]|nr:GNAT family N-acetyltransferase [Chloroflexota bacterium]